MPDKEPASISRRTFLKGTAALTAGGVLSVLTPRSIVPVHSEVRHVPIGMPIPGDIVLKLPIPVKSEIQAAGLEEALDEPNSKLIHTEEKTNESGEIYREYTIEYNGDVFKVRSQQIPSTRYPALNEFYNEGTDQSTFTEKQISVLTFDSGDTETHGLRQVTVYCLSQLTGDPQNPDTTYALPLDFYEQNSLREAWTALQFAQAFNPKSIRCISDNAGISTRNAIPDYASHKIQSASAILANFDSSAGAVCIVNPQLPSNSGGLWDGNRLTPIEREMHSMASVLAHELRHGTDAIIDSEGTYVRGFASTSFDRDGIHESFATMTQAGFSYDFTRIDQQNFWVPFAFQLKNGEFGFRPYACNLPPIVLLPYMADMAKAFEDDKNYMDDAGAITLEGLVTMNKWYMALRDELITILTPDWLARWDDGILKPENINTRGHADVYAPLVLARKWNERATIAQNKQAFMQEVMETAKKEALPARVKALREAFTGTQTELKPYFQDVLETFIPMDMLSGTILDFPHVSLPQDQKQPSVFTRPRDSIYAQHGNEDFYGSDYRLFHPQYHFALVKQPPDQTQYQITQTSPTNDYVVAIKYMDELGVLKTEILQHNTPIKLDKTKQTLVCFLDTRTNQIIDDKEGNIPEIFRLTASPVEATVTPEPITPTPSPTTTPAPTPTPTPTPEPVIPKNPLYIPEMHK